MGAKVDGAYSSLIQGISQQSPVDRIEGQHEAQENMNNDPEKGLLRRPPIEVVASIGKRGKLYKEFELNQKNYLLVIYDTDVASEVIKVFDANSGSEISVSVDNSLEYLKSAKTLSAVTVDDQVFISNPAVVAKMLPDSYPYPDVLAGLFAIAGVNYGRTYRLNASWDGGSSFAQIAMADGSQAGHAACMSTSKATAGLLGLRSDSYCYREETSLPLWGFIPNRVYLENVGLLWTNLNNLSLSMGDSAGGESSVYTHKGKTKSTSTLTRFGMHNFVVKISGTANAESDDFWVRFQRNDEVEGYTVGPGVWIESVAPDVEYQLDSSTMPRRIVQGDDGSLTIERVAWVDREVGDDLTNPIPSFIGHTINDIAYFQGRLVFLSGANVIMSRSHDVTNFWKNSATQLVDDDVIDISSATTTSTPVMQKAVPHARDLVIFSDLAQFIVFGRSAITPGTATLVLTTTYEANTTAAPVAAGKNIFYATDYGRYTGIKEFYTDQDVDINASRPITAHCTQYLKGPIKHLATSTNFDMLLAQTSEDSGTVYLYEYIWINEEKRQSAWSKWIFDKQKVRYFYFDNDQIIFVIEDPDGFILIERIQLDRPDDGVGFQVHLDNKMYIKDVNFNLVIPNELQAFDNFIFVQGDGCPDPGLEVTMESFDGLAGVTQHDMLGGTVIVGTPYTSFTKFTKPVIRDADGRAVSTITLSVHHFEVITHSTGYMEAVTTSLYHDDTVYSNTGWIIDSAQNALSIEPVISQTWVIPFMQDVDLANLTLRTDRYTPMRITQISWKGNLIKQGQHL